MSKYMEKVAAYKREISNVSSRTESMESAYKAAVRYLKNKADKAVANDFDESVAREQLGECNLSDLVNMHDDVSARKACIPVSTIVKPLLVRHYDLPEESPS